MKTSLVSFLQQLLVRPRRGSGGFALVVLLLIALLLPLSSCGGGGSASGAKEGEYDSPSHVLMDEFFMPKGMLRAELVIENSSFSLKLSCLSAAPAWDCVTGNLDATQSYWLEKSTGAALALAGEWEQYGSLNTLNRINGVRVDSADGASVKLQLRDFSAVVSAREDDVYQTDNTIILSGTVAAGHLSVDGESCASLIGSTVRLTYTIADGYVTDAMHGTPAS